MKFTRKRWLSIPVVIVLVLALTSGAAFAAFSFFSLPVAIAVTEPLTIEYNLDGHYGGDSAWHTLGDTDSLTLDRSAGDDFGMRLRINNIADNALTVDTVITGSGKSWFSFTGWPDGTANNVPPGNTQFSVTADVSGSAPPATYNINFAFLRS